jgi:uncharacterized protein
MSIIDDCRKCDAYCCKHVAVHLEKPKSKQDYDHIRWYLLHENVWVSIDLQGDWILEFRSPCKEITKDFKCGDYENRPSICRAYPSEDELCERQTTALSYIHLFTNVTEFEKYLDSKKISWRWKKKA